MGFDATYIPAIMLIVVGVGWMLVWAFGGGERGSETPKAQRQEQSRKATDPSQKFYYEVASSTSTHAGTLERYSRATDAKIRRLVGQNPSTPRETLERLATDEVDGVRSGVARNPSAPPDILQQLSLDRSDRVREAAAASPRFTQVGPTSKVNAGSRVEALERLARLYQQGVLTEQEFKAEKERLLGE